MASAEELESMTRIARMYYLEGMTRIQIANRLDLSRFKVARLLETAVETGVVTITIRPSGLCDPDLSEALVTRFGLRGAYACLLPDSEPATLYDRLGHVGANLLADISTRSDVLGFDAGRTVSHIADHASKLPACDVVQLAGLAGSVQQTGLDILRRVTLSNGGAAYPLYAPMIARDAAAAAALRHEPTVRTTTDRYPQVTIAVVSVGSWTPPVSQVYDRLTTTERRHLLASGVVAETCALMFNEDGEPVSGLDDRRLGITLDQLRAVPNVIAVAGGVAKTRAIRALLTAGVINTLVTDAPAAQALLAEAS